MGALIAGGGSGAVAASAHAGCERFRRTDPLLTGITRRELAKRVGFPDTSGTIPEARWVRAMAFERMVRADAFVSQLLTRAVGLLGMDRPRQVRRHDGNDNVGTTLKVLSQAHLKATFEDEAAMITRLAIPFLHLEDSPRATPVRPDFAIVAPRQQGEQTLGSWLIMGDAKDYERVRSRIDDGRMLKGFLQVALGAESAAEWSKLPDGMQVHRFGALAVPRNVYLRPQAVVEDLADHRAEVRARAAERLRAFEELEGDVVPETELPTYVGHMEATYDPRSCSTCNLFSFCREQLRTSSDPAAVLAEIGIDKPVRPAVLGLVDGTGEIGPAPARVIANVAATATGLPDWQDRKRVDPAGLPGTINVVLAKSDSAALGVHGIAVQRVDGTGTRPWQRASFPRTNATATRHRIMEMLGAAIREATAAGHLPVHLVVPDAPTADVLVSMADSLAGVELSRLRWARDEEEGRPLLTFDGEEATMPDPLSDDARRAVSFLLEEDRARALTLRRPLVNLRDVLASHLVTGGPAFDAGRLDYLVAWATAFGPVDHRQVSDDIAASYQTPGARLSAAASDDLHREGRPGVGDEAKYAELVNAALDYRIEVLGRALTVLGSRPDSKLRGAHRTLEADSQVVWGRRYALHASDLIRFSLTYRFWRNAQVEILEADVSCADRLCALEDYAYAADRARDAGVRGLAIARVVALDPIRLEVASRRIKAGTTVVALHVDGKPAIECAETTVKIQAGGFRIGQLSGATLGEDDEPGLIWEPVVRPDVALGTEVVLADTHEWLKAGMYADGHSIAVPRPSLDSRVAPGPDCTPTSFAADPKAHFWCCRPHTAAESARADEDAEKRARGELNPQTWPPVVDQENFDILTSEDEEPAPDAPPMPESMTMDDLD